MRRKVLNILSCFLLLGWSSLALAQGSSGVSPNVLVLPQGPGSIGGVGENVQANLNMGLMSYSIPILVPQGRGSATPSLSATYSSSSGAGMMGIGWNLNAGGSIERLTVRGLPTYTNTDRFYANGELVKIPSSNFYRARVEGGFVRYRWFQTSASDQKGYWVAEYPDGSKGYFGADSKAQINPNSQVTGISGTFRWNLVTFVDRNGNRVEYRYVKDGSQTYLDQVSWVFDKGGSPLYQVKFSYETRPDPISNGKPGFDLQTKQRLKEVQITSDGTRFRSYSFTFEDQTGLSRLIKVERFGRDGKTRFPIHFSMTYSNATFSPTNSRMVVMPTSLGVNVANNEADFIDINGDGLPDVVNTANPKHVFYLNQLTLTKDLKQDKHDFPKSLVTPNPVETSAKLSSPSVQLMDFNGDGYTDLVDAARKKIYLNKGNSRWESNTQAIQDFPITNNDPNVRFFDYNGDKAIDIIRSDGNGTSYWVNDRKGNWTRETGGDDIGLGFSKDKLRLIDINGDGLMDVVHITSNSLRYKKYLGYGKWSGWIPMQVPGIDQYRLSTEAQFADINGDGMSDMVAFLGTSIVYFVNKNGRAFEAGKKLASFQGIDVPDSTKTTIRIADINGNGSRDIVWLDSNGKVTYLELFSQRPNLLTEISNGIGQRINVNYGSSVYFYLRDLTCDTKADPACTGPWKNKLPMPFTVVTKIATWASRSDKPDTAKTPTQEERPQIQTVYYHNGFYDGVEKKFRGFRHVETVLDGDTSMEQRKEEVKYNVGDTDTYLHGRLLERSVSNGSDKLYQLERYEWGDCPLNLGSTDGKTLVPPVRFVCQKSSEQDVIEGKPNAKRTLRQEVEYDGFGNQTLVANLGEKGKEGDEQVTKTTYITPQDPNADGAKWLLRFPQKIEYCSGKTGPCAAVELYYDGEAYKGLPVGQIEKGNLSRSRVRVNAGQDTFVEPRRQKFDSYGNLIGTQTATGQQRDVTWDSRFNRFPETETLKLTGYELKASTQWNYSYSRVVESTNFNNQKTRYTYDSFGRLSQVFQPGDANDKPSAKYSYVVKAPLSQIVAETRSQQNGNFDRKTITCFDGLGRQVSSIVQTKPGQFLVSSHIEYNREGLRAREWNSYNNDGTCKFVAPQSVSAVTTFYDTMRRVQKKTYADGSFSSVVFEPLKRISFDPEDNRSGSPHQDTPTIVMLDGLGRVVEEQQVPVKGKVITTKFVYTNVNVNGASLVTSVTFTNGSTKTHEYNLFGKVTKVTDPDRNTTTYTYNADNLVTSRTDSKGIKVLFTYDGLRRLLTRQQDGKPETKITYTYDKVAQGLPTATFTNGRRTSLKYPGGEVFYSYDVRGNISLTRRKIMGVEFDFTSTYNNTNDRVSYSFPNGSKHTYTHDGFGRVLSVAGKIDAVTYHPEGQLLSWKASNGIQTTYKYDKRVRLTQLDVGTGKVMTLDYTMDANSNITEWKQKHGDSQFSNLYSYDSLYRLTQAKLADNAEVLDLKQDDMHNITEKVSSLGDKSLAHIGSYTYDGQRVHAATQAGAIKLSYDAIGQATKQGNAEHQWDYLGRRTQTLQQGKVVGRYWYNHAYQRIIREEQGIHTFYISKQYEIREGAVVNYVSLGNDRQTGTWSVKGVETFFDDLAPATGDQQLQPKPDGAITAADAWLYHANRSKLLQVSGVKARPIDLDLTRDMLASATQRLLLGDKEETHTYHTDHLGSVRAVTDAQGNVLKRTHYYPYGAVRQSVGDSNVFSYSYQGSEWDSATQTNYYGFRSLAPRLGRWLSPDPAFREIGGIADEFNSYGMVLNNPIRMRDVQGLFSLDSVPGEVWGAVGGSLGFGFIVVVSLMVHKARSLGRQQSASVDAGRVDRMGDYAALAQRVTPGGPDAPDAAPRRSSASIAAPAVARDSIARPDTPGGTPEGRRVAPGLPAPPPRASIVRPETPGGPGGATAAVGEPGAPEGGFARRRSSSQIEGLVRGASFAQVEGRRRSSGGSRVSFSGPQIEGAGEFTTTQRRRTSTLESRASVSSVRRRSSSRARRK